MTVGQRLGPPVDTPALALLLETDATAPGDFPYDPAYGETDGLVDIASGSLIGRLTSFLAVIKSPSARSDNLIYA
jgi:hypothetical protein